MNQILFTTILFLIFNVAYSQKYVQVWGDEFNTKGLPDSTKWTYETGKIRNNELQYYTKERLENTRIEDSVLIIEVRKENFLGESYTSGSIISKGIGDWKYGKIEIRAKVPAGKGTWPALWMMPTYSEYGGWPKSGEIDIMEYIGVEPQNLYFNAHFEGTNGSGHQSNGSGRINAISDPFNKFIKLTLLWTPDKLEWFANDVKYHEYKKPSDDYRSWPFNKEFYLILNLAYGGNWGGYNGVDNSKLPCKFLVDYVRVYQLQETEGPFGLNIKPPENGKVDISPKMDLYPEGTEVTLTAIPNENFVFKAWQHLSRANPYTFIVNKNIQIVSIFNNKNEILSNGNFNNESTAPWTFYVENDQNSSYTASIKNNLLEIDISKSPNSDWKLGFQEVGLSLPKAKYKLTFDAYAEQTKKLLITVSKNYSDWGSHISKSVTITNSNKKYEIELNMPVSDENVRLYFGIGNFTGKFYIDNISLSRMEENTTFVQNNIKKDDNIKIFPNPSKGEFTVSIHEAIAQNSKIEIFDVNGNLILTDTQIKQENSYILQKQSQGIYFIHFFSNNRIINKKIVIN